MFNTNLESLKEAYTKAIDAIINLREEAEEMRYKMEEIINACLTLEGEI